MNKVTLFSLVFKQQQIPGPVGSFSLDSFFLPRPWDRPYPLALNFLHLLEQQ